MIKIVSLLTICTMLSFSEKSNALDIKIGQVFKISSATQFKSPYSEFSNIEVIGMKLISSDSTRDVVEIELRPFLNTVDRQRIANVPSDPANQTFTFTVVNLNTISEIPGLQLVKESQAKPYVGNNETTGVWIQHRGTGGKYIYVP